MLLSIATTEHVVENQSTSRNIPPRAMEMRAAVRIHEDAHLKPFGGSVSCRFHHKTMTLTGRVPSYYHKQLVQEVVRALDGIEQVENRLRVQPVSVPPTSRFSETQPFPVQPPHFASTRIG